MGPWHRQPAHAGKALADVAAVRPQVLIDHGFQKLSAGRRQFPPPDQQITEGGRLLEDPFLHRTDQFVARDEIHLERQHAEEQVAVGYVGLCQGRPPKEKGAPNQGRSGSLRQEALQNSTWPTLPYRERGPSTASADQGLAAPFGGFPGGSN